MILRMMNDRIKLELEKRFGVEINPFYISIFLIQRWESKEGMLFIGEASQRVSDWWSVLLFSFHFKRFKCTEMIRVKLAMVETKQSLHI